MAGPLTPAEGQQGERRQASTGEEVRDVLFIGNSYTYYNNLPAVLEAIAAALPGPRLRTQSHLHGGYSLARHLEDGHLVPIFESPPTPDESWEAVVLQEQSRLGTAYADSATGTLGDFGPFHSAVRSLDAKVDALGAEPVLYMTWAKKRFPGQTEGLARAYDDIGRELEAPVAPVGVAWGRVRAERPDLELFDPDGSHPSSAGTYLAACVLYATLADATPLGAPSRIEGVAWTPPGRAANPEPVTLVDLEPEGWRTTSSALPGV